MVVLIYMHRCFDGKSRICFLLLFVHIAATPLNCKFKTIHKADTLGFKSIFVSHGNSFVFTKLCNLQGPTENRQGEWAPWLNIIIIILLYILLFVNLFY